MNVDLESLSLLPQIQLLIVDMKQTIEKGTIEKRWLNTRELSLYTGYKFETIQTKIKKGEFTKGVHYFKKGGILLFDKIEVDYWVMGVKSANNINFKHTEVESIVDDILPVFIA